MAWRLVAALAILLGAGACGWEDKVKDPIVREVEVGLPPAADPSTPAPAS